MSSLRILRLPILFVVCVIILHACAADYSTNMINSPALKQQGDLQIGGGVGHLALNGQAAYAVSNNIGIVINGKEGNSYYSNDVYSTSHSELFVEAGAGYYKWFSPNSYVECYAGYGMGEVHNVQTQQQVDITYLLYRPFIQPAIGVQADFFTMNFAARLTHVNLHSDNVSLTGTFIEPAITTKVRFDDLSAIYQMGIVRSIDKSQEAMEIVPFWIAVGFQYNFDFNRND